MPKRSTGPQSGVTWEEVSLPVSGGVDLRSNDRARPTLQLAKLLNGSFEERRSVVKRAGHRSSRVFINEPFFQGDRPADARWVYGWGDTNPDVDDGIPFRPAQRQLRGVCTRGDQLGVWTGDRLFSWSPTAREWVGFDDFWTDNDLQGGVGTPLYIPSGPVVDLPIKAGSTTWLHSSVKGVNLHAHAWIGVTQDPSDFYRTYVQITTEDGTPVTEEIDLSSGDDHLGVPQTTSTALIGPTVLKAYMLEGHFCVLIGNDDDKLYLAHASENNPREWFIESLGTAVDSRWDSAKVDDNTLAVVAWDGADHKLLYARREGATGFTATLSPDATVPTGPVAVGVAPNGELGLAWAVSGALQVATYTATGTLESSAELIEDEPDRLTVCGLPIINSGFYDFTVYAHVSSADSANSQEYTWVQQFNAAGGDADVQDKRWQVNIASQAFAVGRIPFCTLVTVDRGSQTRQATYFLQGGVVNPRLSGAWARQAAGTAVIGVSAPSSGPGSATEPPRSVDFAPGQDRSMRSKWSMGFTHSPRYIRGRQDNRGDEVTVESRGLRVALDFLPELRYAEAGRSTYFAGAAPQQWDGDRIHEAGFLQWPVHIGASPEVFDDGTDPDDFDPGDYQYRVYYCRRNRFGEVSRSPAETTGLVTVPDNTTKVTLSIQTLTATGDDQVYLEIYRTTVGPGATFHLISGFNAVTAVQNDRSVHVVTYDDTAPDSAISGNPADPHGSLTTANVELEEVAPPGCEVISTIDQRVFFSGGIVPRGQVFYTKEFEPGESIGWNDLSVLEYTLDRGTAPVTALAPIGNGIAIFRANDVHVFGGQGPDNLGVGAFGIPQRVSSDLGAVSQNGVTVAPDGVMFWSTEGPRLLTEGRVIIPIADDVAPRARGASCVRALVVPYASQVRFYTDRGDALVYDYVARLWAVHTGLRCAGAALYQGQAVLARHDGNVWFEDKDGPKSDAGRPYEFAWKSAELRRTELLTGSARYRRWAVNGEWRGPHSLTARVYYDGSPYVGERKDWAVTGDVDNDAWGVGAGIFGTDFAGLWPDPDASSARDGVYRTRRRLTRQRASTVSFEFSDNGATGDSFVITELVLELGTKDGLARLPKRSF